MLTVSRLHRDSADRAAVEKLYAASFLEIERYTVEDLFMSCDTGRCEWLVFKDGERLTGMAYMILHDDIAFLLYLAVEENERDKGYGTAMLRLLSERYPGMELILFIESLHVECDNMDTRVRRRSFYIRNGFHDTGYIQSSDEGACIYDILSSSREFTTDRWKNFVAHYPMESYMDELYPYPSTTA